MFRSQGFLSLAIAIVMVVCGVNMSVAYENRLNSEMPAAKAAQGLESSLFEKANDTMDAAKRGQADILAPKNFGKAMKSYKEAESDFKKGKDIKGIRKKLSEAASYFQKALDATKLAEVTFTSVMVARIGAQDAEASQFASALWKQAEEKFAEAAGTLEDGDVNGAKKKGDEAESLYRKAELRAIKVNYLNETWEILKQADQLKVEEYAPKTLQNAKDLIKQAEKELNENRYDTDVPRNLAQQAKYEAKHAIYLSKTINKLQEMKYTFENLMLERERPVQEIAATMDMLVSFESGIDSATQEIIRHVKAYQDSILHLSQRLAESNQELSMMREIASAEEKEKAGLSKRLAAMAEVNKRFATVEGLFSEDEAQVLREGNDVIIRLIGLQFQVGKSTIDPRYFSLLTKAQKAINTFPNSSVTIGGHTDSHGSNELNLKLSSDRAEAVKQYFLANMKIDPSRIEAVGYGESKPIAQNEIPEGRARNRRIEVVIHPKI